jgi:hypothetical protein
MGEHRRKFSPQFKAEAADGDLGWQACRGGRPGPGSQRHDSGELGERLAAEHPEPDQPLSPVESAHVKELEPEVAWLRLEKEFPEKRRPSSGGSAP